MSLSLPSLPPAAFSAPKPFKTSSPPSPGSVDLFDGRMAMTALMHMAPTEFLDDTQSRGVHKQMMRGSASQTDVFENLDRLHHGNKRKESSTRRKLTALMGGPSPAEPVVEPPKVVPAGGEHQDGVAVSLQASLGTKIRYYTEHKATIDPKDVGLTVGAPEPTADDDGHLAPQANMSLQPNGGAALPLGLSPYSHRYRTPLIVNSLGATVVHAVAVKDGRQSAPVRCVFNIVPIEVPPPVVIARGTGEQGKFMKPGRVVGTKSFSGRTEITVKAGGHKRLPEIPLDADQDLLVGSYYNHNRLREETKHPFQPCTVTVNGSKPEDLTAVKNSPFGAGDDDTGDIDDGMNWQVQESTWVEQKGAYEVRAQAHQRGIFSGRIYDSVVVVERVTISGGTFAIPKEIVKGVISVMGTTKSYLRKNQGRFMSSAVAALGLKTSRFKILSVGSDGDKKAADGHASDSEEDNEDEAEEAVGGGGLAPVRRARVGGGRRGADRAITLSYAVEVDETETQGSRVENALMDANFTSRLTTELQARGVKQITAKSVAVESAVSEELRFITLHLEWRFPASGKDYLDGSAIGYAENEPAFTVDYRKRLFPAAPEGAAKAPEQVNELARNGTTAVHHSGDVMSPGKGKHVISVDLQAMPPSITDLFLVLSAYNCGDLAKFPSPVVRLFATDPAHQLTKFALTESYHTEACIMSVLSNTHGRWSLRDICLPSQGTVKLYKPIHEKIATELQLHHAKWRRRGDALRTLTLLQKGRCCGVVGQEETADLFHLILEKVPEMLWSDIFSYL